MCNYEGSDGSVSVPYDICSKICVEDLKKVTGCGWMRIARDRDKCCSWFFFQSCMPIAVNDVICPKLPRWSNRVGPKVL